MAWLVLLFALLVDPWTASDVVQPEALAGRVGQPLIVHVGFPVLYRGAHIKGSVYAGPGSKPAGIDELKRVLAKEPRGREIVLYCGCCPWDKCPNVRPSFTAVREMGFTKVRVLIIPENLAKDWVDKGYPTERHAN
jgi:thiosulfate/3-mercaptopyruvate sulfurtransferase